MAAPPPQQQQQQRGLSPNGSIDDPDPDDNDLMAGQKDKLHEFRMNKIRECLAEERKKNWIYVGNAFREPPMAPSKP